MELHPPTLVKDAPEVEALVERGDAYRFWNERFSDGQNVFYGKVAAPPLDDPALQRARQFFGDVQGKTLIDLGCGDGAASLFFAHYGAQVMAVDFSQAAIENLKKYCRDHQIKNITPRQMYAQEISRLGKVDFVYGSMILHHIEPFDAFAAALAEALTAGGKAFFRENNAHSGLMMWFRKHVVGRFGIVKFSDREERPFSGREVEMLRGHFAVEIEYPELLYFRMISWYLLRNRLLNLMKFLDGYFYRFGALRKSSYHQNILLSKRNP